MFQDSKLAQNQNVHKLSTDKSDPNQICVSQTVTFSQRLHPVQHGEHLRGWGQAVAPPQQPWRVCFQLHSQLEQVLMSPRAAPALQGRLS